MDELQNGIEETELENEETVETEDVSKQIATLSQQKKHWRDKAIDPTTGKTYKTLYEESKAKPVQSVDTSQFAKAEDLIDLKLGQKGFDEETAVAIKAYARGLGKNPLEVLEDKFVKSVIDANKSAKELETHTPDTSNRTISVSGKDVSSMNDKERKASWDQIVKAAARK
jgi:hypothetical protein